jgi:hypothetical protein
MIGQGDYFQAQVTYAQGAVKYVFQATQGSWFYREGDSVAIGTVTDGVYGGALGTTATSVELTTAWNVNAAYEHFWNPRWRTSVYGGYAQVSYNGAANAMMCSVNANGIGSGTGAGTTALANPGCDNDWNTWWVGTRTQWNVTKDFYMGLDVLYQKLGSASSTNGLFTGSVAGIQGPGVLRIDDRDNWQFRFRVHRDFYP